MEENRIEAIQAVIDNLRAEGQTSRADIVKGLVDDIKRLRTSLFLAGRELNRIYESIEDGHVEEAKKYCVIRRDRINEFLGEEKFWT